MKKALKTVKQLAASFKLWVEDQDGDFKTDPKSVQILGVEHVQGDVESLRIGDVLMVTEVKKVRGSHILTLTYTDVEADRANALEDFDSFDRLMKMSKAAHRR